MASCGKKISSEVQSRRRGMQRRSDTQAMEALGAMHVERRRQKAGTGLRAPMGSSDRSSSRVSAPHFIRWRGAPRGSGGHSLICTSVSCVMACHLAASISITGPRSPDGGHEGGAPAGSGVLGKRVEFSVSSKARRRPGTPAPAEARRAARSAGWRALDARPGQQLTSWRDSTFAPRHSERGEWRARFAEMSKAAPAMPAHAPPGAAQSGV
ncbi:hypothetical protein B0J12DRAFT_202922 [Macrophomina phaseolina]|uniref:Uncharacterized protein n=1 Tax=Macrophomina phaseolina TaxID=35725 RepID=A0ABQ8G209_9PEZI|nr:hypothetical protein B0J12DRAFT_202922 [Macrophomina phaseolina]